MSQPSKLTQSPLEREIRSFTRAVISAEVAAPKNPSLAVTHLCEALRTQSVILGVIIKTLDQVVKENKAVTDQVAALLKERADEDAMYLETAREGRMP